MIIIFSNYHGSFKYKIFLETGNFLIFQYQFSMSRNKLFVNQMNHFPGGPCKSNELFPGGPC